MTPCPYCSCYGTHEPLCLGAAEVEQRRQLARVASRIGEEILAFCRRNSTFHGADLASHVLRECGGSPDSASRILRMLRREGRLEYEVVSRAASLYRVVRVEAA